MVSRRKFIRGLIGTGGICYGPALAGRVLAATLSPAVTTAASSIDRAALANRHNPSLHKLDPWAPLSVGNGEFAFTADVTGLQAFPQVAIIRRCWPR